MKAYGEVDIGPVNIACVVEVVISLPSWISLKLRLARIVTYLYVLHSAVRGEAVR
jgi:hypothetical protein